MQKGNVNGALKLLYARQYMQNGILPLNQETLHLLKLKHPEPAKSLVKCFVITDIPESVHPIIFESITPEVIRTSKKSQVTCKAIAITVGWIVTTQWAKSV